MKAKISMILENFTMNYCVQNFCCRSGGDRPLPQVVIVKEGCFLYLASKAHAGPKARCAEHTRIIPRYKEI